MKVKSENEAAQSSPTLSDPMDCSLPGSSVHGIFQARVLEWGAIAFSELLLRSVLFSIYRCPVLVLGSRNLGMNSYGINSRVSEASQGSTPIPIATALM